MVERYYTEEITAVPFRALRQILAQTFPGPVAWGVAALLRLRRKLGWPLAATKGIAFQEGETTVAREAMLPEAIARWAVVEEPLGDLGFRPIRFARVETIGATRKAYALWLDGAGRTVGNLEWTATLVNGHEQQRISLEFDSYGAADPEYTTFAASQAALAANGAIDLDFVDLMILDERHPVAEVYAAHAKQIDGKPVFAMSDAQAIEVHGQRSTRRMRRLMEQGLLRELSAVEIARLREHGRRASR
jgi:hypothetical protein